MDVLEHSDRVVLKRPASKGKLASIDAPLNPTHSVAFPFFGHSTDPPRGPGQESVP